MVESALVFLAFMFILLGSVEFGRMVYAFQYVVQGAEEGARYASLHSSASTAPATNASVTSTVTQWAIGLDSSKVGVTTTWTPTNAVGNTVQVKVTYTWSSILGALVPTSMAMTSQSNMTIVY